MRRAVTVPVVVKGIMTADDARTATKTGARAIVVSSYGHPGAPGRPAPLDVLADVVDAVEGRAEVLVDGGFRRGSDIMKALALGARAVLVGRPVMWGLAAYGADGVQAVLEMLQTELGRVMGCCGTPSLAAISRAHVKVHAPAPPGRTDPAPAQPFCRSEAQPRESFTRSMPCGQERLCWPAWLPPC